MTFSRVHAVDYHTGGEPFRIVAEPPVAIIGDSVVARREFAMQDDQVDGLRQLLCYEPRGHADMYGGFLTPPDDDGAALGVLFWHKDGFSTACGHGTMALGVWAVHSGLVPVADGGVTDVPIDVPSGRVLARVHATDRHNVTAVDFINVASYVLATGVGVDTSRGHVGVDIGFGGANYAQVRASDLGLSIVPAALAKLIGIGGEIKGALGDRPGGIYGTTFYEDLDPDASGSLHQRSVTVFADGAVDRSPCGSGTAARVAVLDARGELRRRQRLVHDSIVGSRFEAAVTARVDVDGVPAIVPAITGMAYRTGQHVFDVDPDDPMVPGFVLR